MAQAEANGIRIEYERGGSAGGPPLLMIHGVGAQLIRWPPVLCEQLAAAGFETIRYDSRDIGLSTHMDGAPVPDLRTVLEARRRGESPVLPYSVSDLAADAAALLDALGIASAHVLGVSLGGMVGQVLAIEHPSRVRSLAVVMSSSGHPDLPDSRPEAMAALSAPPPDPNDDLEGYVRNSIALNRAVGSPAYPAPEAELRALAVAAARRAYNPKGAGRQLAAGRASPHRRAALQRLAVPTLVVHGAEDPLVPPECGEDVARHTPRAWFLKLNGMGHDLPAELSDVIASTIAANARRAGT